MYATVCMATMTAILFDEGTVFIFGADDLNSQPFKVD